MSDASQADMMVELALARNPQLFTDQYGDPYIRYDDGRGVLVTHSLRSGIVKDWLAGQLWRAASKAPGGEAVNSALSVLRAKAREGPTYTLHNRVAPDTQGGILIDMANEGWNTIRVTPDGWMVEGTGEPTFRRYGHMRPLPMPLKGGDPMEILRFANLRDDGHRLLYVITVLSYLIPGIQHPVLLFHGPHGAGKSVSMRAARLVVDPSIVELLHLPRNDRELVQQLYHHYCAFYDNLSGMPEWASDIFCRAVTGTGNTKRALYTDDDDVIYGYRRCIGLNGINIAAHKGDLLDRSIILGCEMMESGERLEEKVLTEMMESMVPSILGGMLDAVVRALNIYPTIQLEKLYRMADFTRWGCALAEALNIDKALFLEAYEENVRAQSEETLKASLIATVLVAYMDLHPDGYRGAPAVLYDRLCEYAEDLKISIRQKAWPKSANWMMRRLVEVLPSLYASGIQIGMDHTGKSRVITVRKNSETRVNAVNAVSGAQVAPDDSNAINDIDDTSRSFTGDHISAQEKVRALLREGGGKLYWGPLIEATGMARGQLEYVLRDCPDIEVTGFHVLLKEA